MFIKWVGEHFHDILTLFSILGNFIAVPIFAYAANLIRKINSACTNEDILNAISTSETNLKAYMNRHFVKKNSEGPTVVQIRRKSRNN